MIRILIADDHGLFRKGIVSVLVQSKNICVIGEAESGEELIEKYFELKPDVILVDIAMPGMTGLEAFEEIFKRDKEVKALFLTMYDGEEYIYRVVKAGGKGLINKNFLEEELYRIVEKVNNGELFFGPGWSANDIENLVTKYKSKESARGFDKAGCLTEREKEIFIMIGKGYSSTKIADALLIAKRTVSTHRTHIIEKLGIKSFHELVKFAVEYLVER